MGLYKTSRRVVAELDQSTLDRIPPQLNRAAFILWTFRSCTHTPKELSKFCLESPGEAQEAADFLQRGFGRIYEALEIARRGKEQ